MISWKCTVIKSCLVVGHCSSCTFHTFHSSHVIGGGPPLHLSLPHGEFLVSCGCHSSVGPCSQCGGTVTNEGHDCYGWRLLWTHPSAPESFSPNQIVPYKFAYVCGYLVDLCLSLSASAKRLCHSRLGRWREIGFGQNHFRWYYHLVLCLVLMSCRPQWQ